MSDIITTIQSAMAKSAAFYCSPANARLRAQKLEASRRYSSARQQQQELRLNTKDKGDTAYTTEMDRLRSQEEAAAEEYRSLPSHITFEQEMRDRDNMIAQQQQQRIAAQRKRLDDSFDSLYLQPQSPEPISYNARPPVPNGYSYKPHYVAATRGRTINARPAVPNGYSYKPHYVAATRGRTMGMRGAPAFRMPGTRMA